MDLLQIRTLGISLDRPAMETRVNNLKYLQWSIGAFIFRTIEVIEAGREGYSMIACKLDNFLLL